MNLKNLPIKIGLTGGIASGKSTAQKYFEALGVPCIDHDLIAKEVVQKNSLGLQQLVNEFGETILNQDNELDRAKLKAIIFSDTTLKNKVEAIIHPLVFEKSEEIRQAAIGAPYILVVSPLLIESGSAKNMFKLIVVDIPEPEQMKRLLDRDQLTPELAASIINNQATRQQRHEAADFILDNSKDLSQLKHDVFQCHSQILQLIENED